MRREVRKQLLNKALPEDSDIVFRTDFIDLFLDDQRDAIVQRCNVADWLPRAPMALFHGRDDRHRALCRQHSAPTTPCVPATRQA